MTTSDLQALRTDLAALRRDMEARFGNADTRFSELETCFMRIEAKLDEKPSAKAIYHAALMVFLAMFAVVGFTIVGLHGIGVIP